MDKILCSGQTDRLKGTTSFMKRSAREGTVATGKKSESYLEKGQEVLQWQSPECRQHLPSLAAAAPRAST